MEFRCEQCQHVGTPASTSLGASGVVFVCANCQHENVLSLDEDLLKSASTQRPRPASYVEQARSEGHARMEALTEETFQRFLPPAGEGLRCPKCANLVGSDELFCSRCGLSIDEGLRFSPGTAPWERAPTGKEDQWDVAALLWSAFAENTSEDTFEAFAGYVRDNDLQDFAARKLRFYLVDHPEDERATRLLREIAATVQSRMMVVKAQAQASTAEFSEVTRRARSVLLWTALLFWLMILLVVVTRYMC